MTPAPATPALSARVRRRIVAAVATAAVAAFAAVVVGAVASAQPGFLAGYTGLEDNAESLRVSAHKDVACTDCHGDRRGDLAQEVSLVGDFYRGLVRKPADPLFVRLERPTRAACLGCHSEDWSDEASRTLKIPHPAHLRVADEPRECVDCHKWTAHEEEYIERHKEMPFSAVCASFGCHVGTKQPADCFTCHHVLTDAQRTWRTTHEKTVRERGQNGCLEKCHTVDQCVTCHTTGQMPRIESRLVTASVKAIDDKHIKKDWIEKHGDVALPDQKVCLACHVSLDECKECHEIRPEFHGAKSTWLNKHKTLAADVDGDEVVENPAKEARCLVCHEKDWCEECHDQFEEMR